MMAIWPVGPPKLMKPSFTQNRNASAKVGCCPPTLFSPVAVSSFIFLRVDKEPRNTPFPSQEFRRRQGPSLPTPRKRHSARYIPRNEIFHLPNRRRESFPRSCESPCQKSRTVSRAFQKNN